MDDAGRQADRQSPTEHADVLDLIGAARGQIDPARRRAILQHCAQCRRCGDELAAVWLLASHGETTAASGTPAPWRRPALAAAAVLAVTVGLGFVALYPRSSTGGPEAPATASPTREAGQHSAPPASPAGAGAVTSGQPAAQAGTGAMTAASADPAELKALATGAPMPRSVLQWWFGRARMAATGDAELELGLVAITEGRYADARDVLTRARRGAPGDGRIGALLGIARYLQDDDSDATVDLLRAGLAERNLADWSRWYLANARLRRGELVDAARALEPLAERPTALGRMAQELRSKLPVESR